MSDLTITAVDDIGGDILRVTATYTEYVDVVDEDGSQATDKVERTIEAAGWVSATTNHYDAGAYGEDGHLLDDVEPRPMSPAEVGSYARQLLLEQHPELAADAEPVTPTAIAFE